LEVILGSPVENINFQSLHLSVEFISKVLKPGQELVSSKRKEEVLAESKVV